MALKPSLLRNAIGVRLDRPATVEEAVQALGGGTRGRSAVAQTIAGTSDKKSKEYKNAMRNVQRWTTTTAGQRRKPTKLLPRVRSKLTTAIEKEREQQIADKIRGPITVTWETPLVQVSSEERERLDIRQRIPDAYLDEFREALARGDEQDAINALAAATAAAWFKVPYGQADATILEASGLIIHGLSL